MTMLVRINAGNIGGVLQQHQGPGVHLHMEGHWSGPGHPSACHDLHSQGNAQTSLIVISAFVLCGC